MLYYNIKYLKEQGKKVLTDFLLSDTIYLYSKIYYLSLDSKVNKIHWILSQYQFPNKRLYKTE